VYALNDNGIPLASSQAEMTPMQRFVYILARDYHTDNDGPSRSPETIAAAQQATGGFR
jgi:hypothetical protein